LCVAAFERTAVSIFTGARRRRALSAHGLLPRVSRTLQTRALRIDSRAFRYLRNVRAFVRPALPPAACRHLPRRRCYGPQQLGAISSASVAVCLACATTAATDDTRLVRIERDSRSAAGAWCSAGSIGDSSAWYRPVAVRRRRAQSRRAEGRHDRTVGREEGF